MPRTFCLLLLLALAALAGPCPAASFDCTKAATKVERQVCTDPALSLLDEALANEYRSAAARGDQSMLRKAQQSWLKQRRDACKDRDCLRQAYEDRIDVLRGGAATYADLPGAIIGSCVTLANQAGADATNCRVNESGRFGQLGGDEQAYAIYCLDAGPKGTARLCDSAGIALFSVDPKTGKASRWLARADTAGEGEVFMKPELVSTKGAQLLHLPVSVPGTGDFNASSLYRRQDTRWIEVDDSSWVKDLAAQLPKGLAAWKGIWPDWKRMHASTGMYRAHDANCCATGGIAEIELALDGNRIDLVSFQVHPRKR